MESSPPPPAYIKWYRDQAYYDSAGWRGTWALDGGGSLMNQSIHTVDALIYLAGPVKSVQANTALLAHERIEVEDHCVAIVEFESGARGVIEASTCTWSKDGHPARVQLSGTDGSVFLADEAFEMWDFREEKPEDQEIQSTLMKGQEAGLGANDPTALTSISTSATLRKSSPQSTKGANPQPAPPRPRSPSKSSPPSTKARRAMERGFPLRGQSINSNPNSQSIKSPAQKAGLF